MAGMNWKNPFTAAERVAATPPQQQSRDGTVRTDDATYIPPNKDNNTRPQQRQQNRSMTVPNDQNRQSRQSNNQQDTQSHNVNNDGDDGDDPMYDFESLWHPNVDKDGKPIQSDDDDAPRTYMPQVDPQKFGAMLEKLDFTRGMTPEDEAAIVAGGPESVKALRGVLNKTNRQAFATMFNAFTKMTESGFANASNRFMNEVPNHVKTMMTDHELEGSNPLLKLPAFAPMVKNITRAYQKKFPKASPGEISTAVNAYFDKMYSDLEASKRGGRKNREENRSNNQLIKQGDPTADFEAWLLDENPSLESQDQQ